MRECLGLMQAPREDTCMHDAACHVVMSGTPDEDSQAVPIPQGVTQYCGASHNVPTSSHICLACRQLPVVAALLSTVQVQYIVMRVRPGEAGLTPSVSTQGPIWGRTMWAQELPGLWMG